MMTSKSGKPYGLILPKKGSGQDVIQRPSVFDDESDSNESGAGEEDWRKRSYQRDATKSTLKRQTKIQMQKALDQDPSVYQYDEVYDSIKEAKSKTAPKKEDNKKQSRYIQSLKKNSEKRKLENERRLERQVQKEREEEGEEFKDKETFVTASYKKKLEEFQKFDEEEQRMDRLEEIGDVTKQKDMSGFYRHIYRSTFDPEKKTETTKEEDAVMKEEPKETNEKTAPPESQKENFKLLDNNVKQKRHYRRRKRSRSSKEEGENTSSSSSESSSSSSSSQSESEEEPPPKVKKVEKKDPKSKPGQDKVEEKRKTTSSHDKENERVLINTDEVKSDSKEKKIKSSPEKELVKDETNKPTKNESKETKPTINLWLKRTVGIQFDGALQRYLERKSLRKGSY